MTIEKKINELLIKWEKHLEKADNIFIQETGYAAEIYNELGGAYKLFVSDLIILLSLIQKQSSPWLPVDGGVLPEEKLRDNNTLYTYYQIELENINEEWDTSIVESLEDVFNTLKYLDIHLDDDTPLANGEKRRVIITGIGMTPLAFEQFKNEYLPHS